MSPVAPATRTRLVAAASVLVLGLGAAGCAHYETLEPYQPAAGVQTDAPGVKVRNLMVVSDDHGMHLQGSLIAQQDDTLTGITGTAQKPSGASAGPLTVRSRAITLPARTAVNLASSNISVGGAVDAGGMTTMTLQLAQAGNVTLQVPVVSGESSDLAKP